MTQRSIVAGLTPTVIIRAGDNVTVEGWDSDRVVAETEGRRGLKVGRRGQGEFGRLRAAVGERVLLDVRAILPKAWRQDDDVDAIEVNMGSSGRVQVPLGSSVKIYSGHNIDLRDVGGRVSVYAGGNVHLRAAGTLVQANSGGNLDLECRELEGESVKLQAGRDLRCYIRSLDDARLLVSDLGGGWEGHIGAGRVTLRLNAGGDVTLVTQHEVTPQGPDLVLGRIERPTN
jgi:hypothetical protein